MIEKKIVIEKFTLEESCAEGAAFKRFAEIVFTNDKFTEANFNMNRNYSYGDWMFLNFIAEKIKAIKITKEKENENGK